MAYAIVFGFFAVIVGGLTAFDAKLFSGKEAPKSCFLAKPGVHCYKDLRISSY